MPEFPISSARILLVSQIQGGGATALPAPLSGTPMPFLRYGNLLVENRNFSHFPNPFHSVPSVGMTPFEFLDIIKILILESFTEMVVIFACVVFTRYSTVTV